MIGTVHLRHDESVPVVGRARDVDGHVVVDGYVYAEMSVDHVEVTGLDGHEATEFVAGLLADHVDGAADGVLTEQTALRAAQHFDTFQVHQIQHTARQASQVHTVHVDTDSGILVGKKRAAADTADGYLGVFRGSETAAEIDLHVGHRIRDIGQVAHRACFDVRTGDGRHRDRGVLQGRFAFRGGDDDLLEDPALRERRTGNRYAQDRCQCQDGPAHALQTA